MILDNEALTLNDEYPTLEAENLTLNAQYPTLNAEYLTLTAEVPTLDDEYLTLNAESFNTITQTFIALTHIRVRLQIITHPIAAAHH